jgi:hypothetical protein
VTATPLTSQSLPVAWTSPDAAHSPAAYWFWHRLPTREEIRRQVGEMLAGGFRSFQIQPRMAYPIADFLGADYLAACAVAVEEAARLGMTVGIYDDYNWQSGQAGGRTVRGADHLRECHVFWSTAQPGDDGVAVCRVDEITSSAADLGPAGMAWQYDEARMAWADWRVVAAVAHPAGGVQEPGQITDVTGSARITAASPAGCTATVDLDPALRGSAVTVFVAARCATSRLPNYLLPESARRFIEVGYAPYFAAFGRHFGSTVTYFFFDQPHATFYGWAQHHGNLASSLPYADALADAVRAATGLALGPVLLALLDDIGPGTAALRCHFYQAYTELACSSYLGPLADWCAEHGVALSGHEVLGHVGSWNPGGAFGRWDLRVNFGMDYFGTDSYRGITGVDAEDCVPQLSTKLGDSVARSNGRSGCIVEQYMAGRYSGGTPYAGDWGLTLSELRAQAIRLELFGARQFLFHGFYQTDGWDGDPSMFTNPRFDFPPGINFEPWWPFHRAFADEVARLSVFLDDAEPACDLAVLYPLRSCWAKGPHGGWGDHVEFWCSLLAEEGLGFHLIDERDLLAARIDGGQLVLGERRYSALVLPSVSTVQSAGTLAAVGRFTAGGGLLVASGDQPVLVQDGSATAAAQQWADILAASPRARHFPSVPERQEARQLLADLPGGRPHVRGTAAAGRVWQWAGYDAEGWKIVAFNDSTETAVVTLTGPAGTVDAQAWDCASGTAGGWESAAGGLELAPMELRALRVRPARDGAAGPADDDQPAAAAPEPVLPLAAGWTLRIPGLADEPVPVLADAGWDEQGFPAYSGTGYYACEFAAPGTGPHRLRLPKVSAAVEVTLNGEAIGARGWEPYEFDLPALRESGNRLEITVFSAGANKYYDGSPYRQHPDPSGLLAPPEILAWPSGRRN